MLVWCLVINYNKDFEDQHGGDIHLRRHEPPDGRHPEKTLGTGPALRRGLRRPGADDLQAGRDNGERRPTSDDHLQPPLVRPDQGACHGSGADL